MGVPIRELAASAAAGAHPSSSARAGGYPGGQTTAGCARPSLSSTGHQFASGDSSAAGCVALLQRSLRLRKCNQGTAGGFCVADVVPGKVLGQRSGVESGDAHLQPVRVVPATSGLAAEGDDPFAEILAVRNRWHFKLSAG